MLPLVIVFYLVRIWLLFCYALFKVLAPPITDTCSLFVSVLVCFRGLLIFWLSPLSLMVAFLFKMFASVVVVRGLLLKIVPLLLLLIILFDLMFLLLEFLLSSFFYNLFEAIVLVADFLLWGTSSKSLSNSSS